MVSFRVKTCSHRALQNHETTDKFNKLIRSEAFRLQGQAKEEEEEAKRCYAFPWRGGLIVDGTSTVSSRMQWPADDSDAMNVARFNSEQGMDGRNERERKRIKQINSTFARLRKHLPGNCWKSYGSKARKLTKVSTSFAPAPCPMLLNVRVISDKSEKVTQSN